MIHPAGPKRVTANTHMAKTDGCTKVHEKANTNALSIDSMVFRIELNNIMKHVI